MAPSYRGYRSALQENADPASGRTCNRPRAGGRSASNPSRSWKRMEAAFAASTPAIITCLPRAAARGNSACTSRRADAAAAPVGAHVHGVLDGEAVAGPGAEVAEGGEAADPAARRARRAPGSPGATRRAPPVAAVRRASPASDDRSPSRWRSPRCRSRPGRRCPPRWHHGCRGQRAHAGEPKPLAGTRAGIRSAAGGCCGRR